VIGLDTNVLVRYLTKDDPAQYAKAVAAIDDATERGDQMIVSAVVLCELVWVLETAYDYTRADIDRALDQILATAQFDIEGLDDARHALEDFRTSKADFSDALIGRVHQRLGAGHTLTFDRNLKGLQTFTVL